MSHDDGGRRFPKPFYSHEFSVERSMDSRRDLASYSSDKNYSDVQRMSHIRSKVHQNVMCMHSAHDSDVNLISWNRSASNLLLTIEPDEN